jgi:hypothetical protein
MGMINIDNFVKSKQIKFIYKIINSEMDSWNAIGKTNNSEETRELMKKAEKDYKKQMDVSIKKH